MRVAWTVLLLICTPAAASTPGKKIGSLRFEIDAQAGRVVRQDAGGKVAWSTKLDRPFDPQEEPALAWDEWRVFVPLRNGVTVLDASTGKRLWHADGPSKNPLVSGRLVVTLGWEGDAWWLVGRGAASGVRVFQVPLPPEPAEIWSVRDAGGLFVVQAGRFFGVKGLLIDRHGTIRHRFNRPVLAALPLEQGGVVLTSHEVMRFSAAGECRWAAPLEQRWLPGGGLVEVGGGGLVAFLYCPIADSGVQLVRFDVATGKVVWRARCAPLGADHSKYRHEVRVTLQGERLRVTSKGSSGTFVELLDLKTGKRLERTVPNN
jgi:outer membrane protein assembly factor BamB